MLRSFDPGPEHAAREAPQRASTARPLKICILVPTHWDAVMGGSQYQAKMLVEWLAAHSEHRLYYVARRTADGSAPRGYELLSFGPRDGRKRYGDFQDASDLLRVLEKVSPDVIYQRVGCAYTGVAAHYGRKRGVRCVWHVAHDEEVLPMQWRLTRNLAFRWIDKLFLEYGVRNASAIVTQTRQQAEYLRRHYGRTEDAVIPNYHPLPRHLPLKEPPVTVAWVANLKPWKRPEVFLRLAGDLQHLPNVRFVMIGKAMGKSVWCRRIEEQAARLPNLTYMGAQPQEVVNEVLARAHLFVNTSTREGFANTFIQAWLRCVPVISLSVNPDGVFDDRRFGVCAGTYAALLRDVTELIRNDGLREAMAREARRYAEERHADERILERLASLLTAGRAAAERLPAPRPMPF